MYLAHLAWGTVDKEVVQAGQLLSGTSGLCHTNQATAWGAHTPM